MYDTKESSAIGRTQAERGRFSQYQRPLLQERITKTNFYQIISFRKKPKGGLQRAGTYQSKPPTTSSSIGERSRNSLPASFGEGGYLRLGDDEFEKKMDKVRSPPPPHPKVIRTYGTVSANSPYESNYLPLHNQTHFFRPNGDGRSYSRGKSDVVVTKIPAFNRSPSSNSTRFSSGGGSSSTNNTSPSIGEKGGQDSSGVSPIFANDRYFKDTSLCSEKVQQLREEVAQKALALKKLEEFAEKLPRASIKSTRNDTMRSDNSCSTINSYYDTSTCNSTNEGAYQKSFDTFPTVSVRRVNADQHNPATTATTTTSAHRVESLQKHISSLKKQVYELTERSKEDQQEKDLLRKRMKCGESKIGILEEQVTMLSELLEKKEERVHRLEEKSVLALSTIRRLKEETCKFEAKEESYQQSLKQLEEDKERLNTNYRALIDSSRSLKQKYHNDLKFIGEKIAIIQAERQGDLEKISFLDSKLKEQAVEREKLLSLKKESLKLRQEHVEQIGRIFDDMRQLVHESDRTMNSKVDSILRVIDQLERQHIDVTK